VIIHLTRKTAEEARRLLFLLLRLLAVGMLFVAVFCY
jgi:hypothetical protein